MKYIIHKSNTINQTAKKFTSRFKLNFTGLISWLSSRIALSRIAENPGLLIFEFVQLNLVFVCDRMETVC